jgi:hypothetical protein
MTIPNAMTMSTAASHAANDGTTATLQQTEIDGQLIAFGGDQARSAFTSARARNALLATAGR